MEFQDKQAHLAGIRKQISSLESQASEQQNEVYQAQSESARVAFGALVQQDEEGGEPVAAEGEGEAAAEGEAPKEEFKAPAAGEPNHIDAILDGINAAHDTHQANVKAENAEVSKQIDEWSHESTGYGPYKAETHSKHSIERAEVDTAACGEDMTADECHSSTRFEDLVQVSTEAFESMDFDQLNVALSSNLVSAQRSEARGDADAAVAKTAAIKNIQKALTARILKRLDDGQPLVEVARKMKAIEGMQPQINDMERRLGIMQSVEPVLENAIKTLQKVVDVRGMGKK